MTDMATDRRKLEGSRETSPVATDTNSAEAQVLVTEQQVLFSTAAAVALPPAKTRRLSDPVVAVAAAVRAIFSAPEKPSRGATALPEADRLYRDRADVAGNGPALTAIGL